LLEETVNRSRALGFDQLLTSALHSSGDLSLDRFDSDTALYRFSEALAYADATGNRRVQIYCVAGIACALLQQGDDQAAARLWESRRTRNAGSGSGCSGTNGSATSA
jgi:hypothetical protein